jgi:hypothetical protein
MRLLADSLSLGMTQTGTGFTRTVVTDHAGAYVMPNLPTPLLRCSC